MKIQDLMQAAPSTCQPWDQLDRVAQKMWKADLGWMPVVDDHERLVGVVTDRDACMHAGTTGQAFADLLVKGCMQHDVIACAAGDDLEAGLAKLSERQVHRLPVVDDEGRVVGVFTMGDVARAWRGEKVAKTRKALGEKAWEVVASVLRPHDEPKDVVVPAQRREASASETSAGAAPKKKAPQKKAPAKKKASGKGTPGRTRKN